METMEQASISQQELARRWGRTSRLPGVCAIPWKKCKSMNGRACFSIRRSSHCSRPPEGLARAGAACA